MGALFSSPSEPITPEPESKPSTLFSSSKPQENQNPKPMAAASSSPIDNPINPHPDSTNSPQETQNPNQTQNPDEPQNPNDQDQEEEGECGFCLFMKGGECRETFINWETCVEEGEKNGEDIVNKCYDATSALKKCMEAHPDYYGVILQAEKDAEQEVNNQLEKHKEESGAGESDQKPKQEQDVKQ